MPPSEPQQTRPITADDRQQLQKLLQHSPHIHRHLDWFNPFDWLNRQPFWAVEWHQRLVAVLACPPDPREIAWIRLFAVATSLPPWSAWEQLWAQVVSWGKGLDISAAAIPIYPWFQRILIDSHFDQITEVVLLSWEHFPLPPFPQKEPFTIRDMTLEDLPQVHQVDIQAFEPLWQYSRDALSGAYTQAAVATVAQAPDGIVGYQISTASSSSGHLARLAVRPDWQGCGVGIALVRHLLSRFHLWGTLRVTVNTQADNQASLALYQKVGFHRTEEVYPVYRLNL